MSVSNVGPCSVMNRVDLGGTKAGTDAGCQWGGNASVSTFTGGMSLSVLVSELDWTVFKAAMSWKGKSGV